MLLTALGIIALGMAATGGASEYCDYYRTNITPELTLTYHPKGGRAYFYGDPPHAADTFSLSFSIESNKSDQHFAFGISWPDAPTPMGSRIQQAEWWDVLAIWRNSGPRVGSIIRVVADGNEIARSDSSDFNAERHKEANGSRRFVLPRPVPDLARYRRLTVVIEEPEGRVYDIKTFKLPVWNKLDKALARAVARMIQAKDEFRPPECEMWPVF